MELKKDAFKERIFQGDFQGNYHRCAKALNVHVAQVHRIINKEGRNGAGALFLGRLKAYCEKQGYNFDDFIFIPLV